MLPFCPCLARRSLSPDSGVAAILSSLTQSPGEQSTLFHVVVKQLNTESRSVVSELQQAPEFAHFTQRSAPQTWPWRMAPLMQRTKDGTGRIC